MSHPSPLVERLVSHHGASWVDAASLADFLARPGDQVLFFSGDPVRFPEGPDVAVVLPELQALFKRRFHVAVAKREGDDALALRFGSQRWPALVFVRDGCYVATLAGMHDWDDYVRLVAAALDTPATRAPGVGIAVVSGAATASGCH